VQSAQRFQRGQDAEHAVKFSSGRLGIEVASHGNGRHTGLQARPAGVHHPHIVNTDLAPQGFGFASEPVADLAVRLGQGQPAQAAFIGSTDRGGPHDVIPQMLGIDRQIVRQARLFFHMRGLHLANPNEPGGVKVTRRNR
jgi:hypothetical protein